MMRVTKLQARIEQLHDKLDMDELLRAYQLSGSEVSYRFVGFTVDGANYIKSYGVHEVCSEPFVIPWSYIDQFQQERKLAKKQQKPLVARREYLMDEHEDLVRKLESICEQCNRAMAPLSAELGRLKVEKHANPNDGTISFQQKILGMQFESHKTIYGLSKEGLKRFRSPCFVLDDLENQLSQFNLLVDTLTALFDNNPWKN